MKKVLVSACLLGKNCRYDGGNCLNEKVIAYLQDKEVIAVCPEQLGGFATPRLPAELRGKHVFDIKGKDVTTGFIKGAKAALNIAKTHNCQLAILKDESPSCGKNRIFDGTFKNKLISGSGITANLLRENGLELRSEEEIE